jgi:hypothetical protein
VDRKSLIVAALLVAAACKDILPYEGAFDVPVAASILPTESGPFTEPIGFVANAHGGQISLLALKQGRFVTDDPTASFLRTNPLPTGSARLLTSTAVWAEPDSERIYVFAGDKAYDTLVRVPYIVRVAKDGFPVEGWEDPETNEIFEGPQLSEPVGTGVAKFDRRPFPKHGYTATEDWELAFDGQVWWVTGSRSGLQRDPAFPGESFQGAKRNISFTLAKKPKPVRGDIITFSSDNGLIEYDVGGAPLHLSLSADQSVLAMIVQDRVADRPVVRWFDPVSETVLSTSPLPIDAAPSRITWAPDGQAIFTADTSRPGFWEIPVDGSAPIEHVLPWPTIDVAVMDPLASTTEDETLSTGVATADPNPHRLQAPTAYVVPIDARSVWRVDLATSELLDVNDSVPGVLGLFLGSAVQGIEAIQTEHLYQERDDDNARLLGRSVGISVHSGRVVFMEPGTGCLLRDDLGPRSQIQGQFGASADFETNFASASFGPFLEQNALNTRHVLVNPCAGIARQETWTLRYNQNQNGWDVSGSISGDQEAMAFEDVRYMNDNGAISFVIRAGGTPTEDGWTITFSVTEGAMSANGDIEGDGQIEFNIAMAGDPVFFDYIAGYENKSRNLKTRRSMLLLPAASANKVGRVNPEIGAIEAAWE